MLLSKLLNHVEHNKLDQHAKIFIMVKQRAGSIQKAA